MTVPITAGTAVRQHLAPQIGAAHATEYHRILLFPDLFPEFLQFLEQFRGVGRIRARVRQPGKQYRFRSPILGKMAFGPSFLPDLVPPFRRLPDPGSQRFHLRRLDPAFAQHVGHIKRKSRW